MPEDTKAALVPQKLINRMWKLYNSVTAEDCAGLSGQGEHTQYKKPSRNLKQKSSGKQPADYNAVECLVDFKAAMDKNNYAEAVPFYFHLRRFLHHGG